MKALVPTGQVTVCCSSHVPGEDLWPAPWLGSDYIGECCDPTDCRPCCPDCPTCPTIHISGVLA